MTPVSDLFILDGAFLGQCIYIKFGVLRIHRIDFNLLESDAGITILKQDWFCFVFFQVVPKGTYNVP